MAVVLIVEDEIQVLVMADSILQDVGHETLTASSVAEALAIIESKDKGIDLLFTDIGLIDETEGGLKLGQAFAEARPGSAVLYTTARSVTDGMIALFAEPHGFLAKPYTAQNLLTAVRNLLDPTQR